MRRWLALPAVGLASVLALAGCSANAPETGSSATPKELTTDFGVTRTEIVLGALTDDSSPFSEFGTGVLHGQQLWIKEANAAGGICQRKITLKIGDYQDNAVQASIQYTALEPKVLGFMHIVGSSAIAALSQRLIDDETTAVAVPASSKLLSNPYVVIPATTYDVEMINGLSYLMEQGKIRDGDTIGHIWREGDYGANGLRGAQYFAQRHRLTLREAKVSTESPIREIVAAFAAEPRVQAIALSTTPDQTAAAAAANQELRLDVPMIGNSPTFTPGLLTGPAAGALNNLSVAASSVPFSSPLPTAQHVAESLPAGRVPRAAQQRRALRLRDRPDLGPATQAGLHQRRHEPVRTPGGAAPAPHHQHRQPGRRPALRQAGRSRGPGDLHRSSRSRCTRPDPGSATVVHIS